MNKLEQLKEERNLARKTRATVSTAVLTTMLGELETQSKKTGGEITDVDVERVAKKMTESIQETVSLSKGSNCFQEIERIGSIELKTIAPFLPVLIGSQELTTIITEVVQTMPETVAEKARKGYVMKQLKSGYTGRYDSQAAIIIIDEILA